MQYRTFAYYKGSIYILYFIMVFHSLDNLPNFTNPVITIGSFDGLHHGHKVILQQVVKETKLINGESVLITFEPHPRKIISPNENLGLLSNPDEKTELILAEGIDHIVFVPFTRDFSMMSASEYVKDFLIKHFNPAKIIIGYDHKFGHSREGDIHLLKNMAGDKISIIEIAPQLVEKAAVSSTKIRKALMTGNLSEANHMLERNYTLKGTVVKGDGIGRKFGFPTANIQSSYSDQLIPMIGVYSVWVHYNQVKYKGMLSIGVRPTINDLNKISCEVNILDFQEDIYGQQVSLEFLEYQRPELKFNTIDDLIAQIKMDELHTRQYFTSIMH